jgi:hypothetical protein
MPIDLMEGDQATANAEVADHLFLRLARDQR